MKQKCIVTLLFIGLLIGLLTPVGIAMAGAPKVKLGVQPWLGYGPFWIADKKGFFEKHGIDVEVINFTWDADMGAAVASGKVQVIAAATNFLIAILNQDIDLQGFLVLDASYEADAVLAPDAIRTVGELKGKNVAYEAGATSDLLINYALKENGLSIKDVKPVQMAASDAGLALIAGRVDVAVTYEPYISAALRQGKGFHVLYTAAERPGLISDLAVASRKYIEDNPEIIKSVILAWDDAVQFLKQNPEEGGKIIADAVHSPMDEFKIAMEGVRIFDLKKNSSTMKGEFQKTMVDIGQIMMETTPENIKKIPDPDTALATKYVQELVQ